MRRLLLASVFWIAAIPALSQIIVVPTTGGGGGGSPGGSDTQVQYNNASAFGGLANVISDGAGSISFNHTQGTAPFAVTSSTLIPNLNASKLLGNTWAQPAAIGGTTPAAGAFTTLSATGALTYGGVALTAGVTGTGNMVLDTSPVLTTPNLGTPSALVGTNISGTAASLTAGTVTTNANLTGVVTSVGNATSFAASPTFTTPNIGVATATSVNKVTITQPATGSTLTVADGKVLTISNTLTFTGTDSTSFAFPTSGSTVMTLATPGNMTGALTVGTGSGLFISGANDNLKFNAFLVAANTAPTLSGCGTSASVTNQAGTISFNYAVGTSPATTCTITLPTASHGWHCIADDITTTTEVIHETSNSTTTCVMTYYAITTGTATAPTANDNILVTATGY